MCEKKKFLKRQKKMWDNRSLTESEVFIYPMGIKRVQSMN